MRANFSFRVPHNVLSSGRPVLLVAGGKEERGLLRAMAGLHAHLPGSSLQVHPGVRHGMPLAQPERFNHILSGWLAATDARIKPR
ncbi:alpha/beta fold hydrolase [Arthrobacter mobilis]|uniref:Uncharacterized protein n=1 Tax=Arthrobacter mobilis TaxID=2724944 RepID=A0A7X6K573_9MICC|nr:hypothetical protein [Arthrobacter mobilis]NKX55405.1 hypothetical protein [Arthrobacter mobilis]